MTFDKYKNNLSKINLFLSGGGSGNDSKEIDDLFANHVDKSKPLLYIPVAMDQNKISYSDCFKFISNTFNKRGIKNIVMWTEKDIKYNKTDLSFFGGIYVGGGNTFYLLKKLKETNFDKKLIDAIEKGTPYFGGSAGAIICGESILIATLSDENKINLRDLTGLKLLSNYSIFCHYKPINFKKINEFSKINNSRIIALPENCGIYYCGEIKLIGGDNVKFF